MPGKEGEESLIVQLYKILETIKKDEKISPRAKNTLVGQYKSFLLGLKPLVEYFNNKVIPAQQKQIQEAKMNIKDQERQVNELAKMGKEYKKYVSQ